MSWLLLSLLAVAALTDGSVQINLQKSIDIVGGGYSVLNITNGVSQLSGNIVSGIVDVKIAPVHNRRIAEQLEQQHQVRPV